MGYYIEVPENKRKAEQLIKLHGAEILPFRPRSLEDLPAMTALICVVDNIMFEAAAYCYSQRELEEFSRNDGRSKKWLVMNKPLAEKLSGFL